MNDTLLTEPAPPGQDPKASRRTPAALAVIAALAVMALAVVAVVAVVALSNDNGATTMMGNQPAGMTGPMMGPDGSHMTASGPMAHAANSPTVAGAREIPVTARSFSFTPAEIHVEVNEDVTVVLTSTDIGHDLTVDEVDLHVAADLGETARGGLHAPSTPGRFTFYCTVSGHRQGGMTGVLVVDPAS